MSEPLDLRLVRSSTFERLVNTAFVSADLSQSFVLIEVEGYGEQPDAPRTEPFSLVFSGEPGLEQGTYELEHATLGRLDLFLVPIGPGPDGRSRYEAVFN